MLDRVVVVTGPGAALAWSVAESELKPRQLAAVFAGHQRLVKPWTLEDHKLLIAHVTHWGHFRESCRILNASFNFEGFMVIGVVRSGLVTFPPLDRAANMISVPELEGSHARMTQAQRLLGSLGLSSDRLESLIRGAI